MLGRTHRVQATLRATLCVLGVAWPAVAQDMSGLNCASWISETLQGQTPKRAAIEQWLRGYIAGARAEAQLRRLSVIESAALMQRLEGYCGDKPLMRLTDAATIAAGAAR